MPINAHPEYIEAEKEYSQAETSEEKLLCLEKMISTAPTHKGAENLRAQLRLRYKKLKESLEKSKKAGKAGKTGIKKAEMQAVILGFPNTGKSSFFSALTNKQVKVSPNPFSTLKPILGTIEYEDVKMQLIDMPPFPNHEKGIINSTDTILLIVDDIQQIEKAKEYLQKAKAKIIVIYTKADTLSEEQKRKLKATLQSKKINFFLFPTQFPEGINQLKKKIFETFSIIRVYTKEPRKDSSKTPMILKQGATTQDVAEKILKGMSSKIKRAKIWGPSSKFPGQVIGINHTLKDKDIVEFQTK